MLTDDTTVVPVLEHNEDQRYELWLAVRHSYDRLRDNCRSFSAYKRRRDKAYGLSLGTD